MVRHFEVEIHCVVQQQSKPVFFFLLLFFFYFLNFLNFYFYFLSFFFFSLSQLVAKLNVLVSEMTHQQPEVLRGDRANFSFTSLSIASVLVFTAVNVSRLVMLVFL